MDLTHAREVIRDQMDAGKLDAEAGNTLLDLVALVGTIEAKRDRLQRLADELEAKAKDLQAKVEELTRDPRLRLPMLNKPVAPRTT